LAREIGQALRETRLSRGEDLEVVSEHLRIRPHYLEALEQGEFSHIPARVYLLGYLRSYAQHLGLDGEVLVRRLAPTAGRSETSSHPHAEPADGSRRPRAAIAIALLLLGAGSFAVYHLAFKVEDQDTGPEAARQAAESAGAPAGMLNPGTSGSADGPERAVLAPARTHDFAKVVPAAGGTETLPGSGEVAVRLATSKAVPELRQPRGAETPDQAVEIFHATETPSSSAAPLPEELPGEREDHSSSALTTGATKPDRAPAAEHSMADVAPRRLLADPSDSPKPPEAGSDRPGEVSTLATADETDETSALAVGDSPKVLGGSSVSPPPDPPGRHEAVDPASAVVAGGGPRDNATSTPPSTTSADADPGATAPEAIVAEIRPPALSREPAVQAALPPPANVPGPADVRLAMRETPSPAARFTILVASVRDPAAVAGEWRRLARLHASLAGLELQPPRAIEVPGKGTFYRVLGGAFATNAEARAACERLMAEGGNYCRPLPL
jgi:hypothetical protein